MRARLSLLRGESSDSSQFSRSGRSSYLRAEDTISKHNMILSAARSDGQKKETMASLSGARIMGAARQNDGTRGLDMTHIFLRNRYSPSR